MSEEIKTYTVAELEKKLTDREKKYCYHKIIEGNGAKAARLAGYKESNARGSSAENLAKPHIQQYIAHLKEDMEDVLGITKFKVAERVMKIAFSDTANLHDSKGYMDMLNKMMGYYEADKVDMTTKGESVTSLRSLGLDDLIARAKITKTVERNEEQSAIPKDGEETD